MGFQLKTGDLPDTGLLLVYLINLDPPKGWNSDVSV